MARRTRYQVLGLLPVVALAFVTTACVESTESGAVANGVPVVQSGKLTTCAHLPYVPFQYSEGDKVVGFDVDLINLVARKLGVPQEITNTQFDVIKSGAVLNSNQCDLVAGAISITETRKQNLDFSDSYFRASLAILAKKGAGYTSLEALKGKKLGVQAGTTGKDFAEKFNAANGNAIDLVTFEDVALEETAVKTGQVDAAINDNGPLLDYAKKNPETEVTTEFDTNDQYGFGVKKGNKALLDKINEALAESARDGSYVRIYEKWFGKPPNWKPGDPAPSSTQPSTDQG